MKKKQQRGRGSFDYLRKSEIKHIRQLAQRLRTKKQALVMLHKEVEALRTELINYVGSIELS